MVERCYRVNNPKYPRYGGRGVTVCPRWRYSFPNFLADVGRRPSQKHTIDRRRNNGHYVPRNVRWATQKIQQRNRFTNRRVVFQGRRMALAEAVELSGLRYGLVKRRLQLGWTSRRALSTPAGKPGVHHG